MGALTNIKPRTAPPVPAPDAVEAPAVDTTAPAAAPIAEPTHITSYDTESIARFMGMEPELPPLPNAEGNTAPPNATDADGNAQGAAHTASAGTGAPTPEGAAPTPDTEDTRSWYQRWFTGRGADGPEQMEQNAEMDAEMYAMTAEATAEITDTALPLLIGRMHDQPAENFKATDEQKGKLAIAWELYLRHKQLKVSPLQFLIFRIFIVYGVNLMMGLFSWVGRLGVYGWHMPWSDSWKRKNQRLHRQPMAENMSVHESVQQPQPPQNAAEPRKPAPWETQPQPTAAPTPAPTEPPKTAPESTPINLPKTGPNYRTCIQTGKMYRAGEGFPQLGKHKMAEQFPDLVDKFKDYPAFMAYSNKHALMGQGGKPKAKDTQP